MSDTLDWVTARLRSTTKNAFEELRDDCQKMVDVRKESLDGGAPDVCGVRRMLVGAVFSRTSAQTGQIVNKLAN